VAAACVQAGGRIHPNRSGDCRVRGGLATDGQTRTGRVCGHFTAHARAASTLGEHPWRVFWRVDVPLAWRGMDAIVTNSLHYAPPADVGVQVEPV